MSKVKYIHCLDASMTCSICSAYSHTYLLYVPVFTNAQSLLLDVGGVECIVPCADASRKHWLGKGGVTIGSDPTTTITSILVQLVCDPG